MDELHFARPLWLLALPLGPLLAWAFWYRLHSGHHWQGVCDPELLPHLLVAPGVRRHTWPLWALAVAGVLSVLALAGPAWERLEQQVYRTVDARVLVLDLSRSMDASDLAPSRLVRARFKVVDVLRRSGDRPVGLAVFAGDGFMVTPLTQDANTLISLLPAVDTSIMPVQGSRADLGLKAAAELLARGGARRGQVLLITDGVKGRRAEDAAARLLENGFRVSVLAAGTPEGAPIPIAGGGFLKDLSGTIVIPMTDFAALRAIARAGGGRFAPLANDDSDIDALLDRTSDDSWETQVESVERTSESWRDRGPWLLLVVVPLAALGFRRGWLLLLPMALFLPVPPVQAASWADIWAWPDQQAARALEQGEPNRAAAVARDPLWKGSALYRGGQYGEAAEAFAQVDNPDAHYNRGNALARAGQLREAIEAYDTALAKHAGHEDATHNRALVASLLEQLEQRASQQQSGDDSGGGRGGADGAPEGAQQEGEGNSAEAEGDNEISGNPEAPGTDEPVRPEQTKAGRTQQMADSGLTPEEQQAIEQWLRRVPDDPGGLLRRKFKLEYQNRASRIPTQSDAW
jgi:Ca-activated chloride channel family protein